MVDHLLHRYGTQIRDIVEICRVDAGMARPLAEAPAYLRAEIEYAVTHEGALHLEDVMHRRTRMVYEYTGEAQSALPEVGEIVASLLAWSGMQLADEVASYLAVAAADDAAALATDDESAARARATAEGIVQMVDLDNPATPS